jgi:two-component system response regulator
MNVTDPVEILLVEDSPYDVKLTLRALGKHIANQVHVVRDGEEALDFMFSAGRYAERSISNRPRVILLDIKLPKVDGLEVLRRLREDPRTCSQPVVLLTSSAERRDITLAYALHANSYIVKPVKFPAFADAVRELGMYWLLLNRAPEVPADESPGQDTGGGA